MRFKQLLAVILAAMMVLFSAPLYAQGSSPINANTTVSLSANVGESLTVSATPGSVSFSSNGTASGPITISTSWNVNSNRLYLDVLAYFSSTTALSAGSNVIPASAINSNFDGSGSVPCNEALNAHALSGVTVPNGCGMFETEIIGLYQSQRTDTVLLSIPTLATGAYAPGSYSGALNVEAVIL